MSAQPADPRPGHSRVASRDGEQPAPPASLPTHVAVMSLVEETHASAVDAGLPALEERFERRQLLGMGGVGAVYLAHDRVLKRDVALKVLQSVQRAALPSLLDEARSTARVRHPNVVAVLDAGLIGGQIFVAFEYVVGQSLRKDMKSMPANAALRVLRDIAAGLAAAHAADVLHLDVKPENILIGADRRARVIDFGLARTRVGGTCLQVASAPSGTPAYMAPELWAGEEICDGTDVWSFAVLAFELLVGRRPYDAETPAELMVQVLNADERQPPTLPNVDPALTSLLVGGLRRWRGSRPYMRDIEAALARVVNAT